MSLSSGARLGPYEILGAIGAGGMGEVYRARDTRLERTVAIKILPAHLSDSPAARQRLEREARAVSSLSHPHICALYDVGHENGTDFLVMEHLEGETLADRIGKGALPVEETLRYAIQIADALDKAHRQGVVHRDLKPGNVMLTRDGAKLLDFGLAKAALPPPGAGELSSAPTMTTPLTAEGTIVGTFQYMAPEQLEGKEADARSDIFAFGMLLHEMVTGRKAFHGKTQAGLIASILKEEPPPVSTVQPTAPPALDRVVQTCLAKDPDERRQSMHDVLLELKWIAGAGSQAGVPVPVAARRRARARLAWTATAVLAIAVVVLAVVAARLASRTERVVRAFIPPPEGTVYALSGPRPGPVAVSPDGTKLAFVTQDDAGDRILWVRSLDALSGQPLAGTENAIYPFWSPDSRTIGFFSGGKLKKIDAAGGPVLSLCDASNGKGGTWNEDGTILFAPDHQSVIHRVAAAGGDPVPVTVFDEEREDNSHRFPQFLPDGRHFLYFARAGAGQRSSDRSAVAIGLLDDEPGRELFKNLSHAVFASGYLLYARENALMARPFDPSKLETTGDAFPIANEVAVSVAASRGFFSVSDNGVLVYQTRGLPQLSELAWMDMSGNKLGTLGEPAENGRVVLSPDGSAIAVTTWDADQGSSDLWIYEVQRGIRTRFTFDPGDEANPVWSPDGTKIVFNSNREGVTNLYISSIDGTEPERLLLQTDKNKTPTDWSGDGSYVIFNSDLKIWALPLSGDAEPFVVIQPKLVAYSGLLSPDGRWIAYASEDSGQREVYLTSFPKPGRQWQISTDGGALLRWRSDGREIYYRRRDEVRATAIEFAADSVRIGSDRLLFENKTVNVRDLTPDGGRLLVEIPVGVEEIVPLTLVVNWTADLD